MKTSQWNHIWRIITCNGWHKSSKTATWHINNKVVSLELLMTITWIKMQSYGSAIYRLLYCGNTVFHFYGKGTVVLQNRNLSLTYSWAPYPLIYCSFTLIPLWINHIRVLHKGFRRIQLKAGKTSMCVQP